MKTSKHAVTVEPKDFPTGNSAKQAWIKTDDVQIHIVIGHDGSVSLSRWSNKDKLPNTGRVKITSYKY